ncbi:MAG: dTDP-4-dehydrorhamnose reductase [Bryobacterales bacterium]
MKILLFGANGQVGREVIAAAADADVNLTAASRDDADLAAQGAAAAMVSRIRPDLIINAAAWTAVDKAEAEDRAVRRINGEAPGELAVSARRHGARLIHLSTDYVFSGAPAERPLDETSPVGPVNVYGETKLLGERLVLNACPDAVVLRTSWVYSSHGSNFVRTMLRLAATKDGISVVADQIGGPTPARAIAGACLKIAHCESGPGGVFHFQGAPPASWADFAEAIFAAAGAETSVMKIETRAYPTPARRPLYTVLNCSKILRDYGVEQPDWRCDLPSTVARILNVDPTQL